MLPGLEHLAVGQRFMTIFTLTDFEVDRHLTLHSQTRLFGEVGISYVLGPHPGGCRLVAKVRVRAPRAPVASLLRWMLPAGDLVMMRKQLRTLRDLAEATGRETPTRP